MLRMLDRYIEKENKKFKIMSETKEKEIKLAYQLGRLKVLGELREEFISNQHR